MFFNAPLFVVKDNLFHGESGGVVLDKEDKIVGIIRTGIETLEEQPISKPGFVPIHLITEDINKKGDRCKVCFRGILARFPHTPARFLGGGCKFSCYL